METIASLLILIHTFVVCVTKCGMCQVVLPLAGLVSRSYRHLMDLSRPCILEEVEILRFATIVKHDDGREGVQKYIGLHCHTVLWNDIESIILDDAKVMSDFKGDHGECIHGAWRCH